MALADLQAFIVQSLGNVDPTLDLSSGSPYDVGVVQPILQRLGTDPYTVDIGLFVQTTLNQQFPDMPTSEGDAFTDLFIKAAVILWNPIVREVTRVANNLSFQNPQILTVAEAQALGANLFATLDQGSLSRGVVRIYFAQPQNCNISPANYVSDNQGLHFFPTEIQSIGVTEMLLNLEGTLYYFDINVIAEAAGAQYNDPADSVVTIANIQSAVRITNKARFAGGTPPQTAVEFINQAEQSLTERSLVTQRGVAAQLTRAFPQLTNLNVRGFNDPEMNRDILTGGGLGPILAATTAMGSEPDGENAATTRRLATAPVLGIDFTALIGPPGPVPTGYVITAFDVFPTGVVPNVQDLDVIAVVDPLTVDVAQQVMAPAKVGKGFTLRRRTLTLSGIPGGILFPNQPDGTVTLPSNEIHIGGCTDVYILDPSTANTQFVISAAFDDAPVLQGVALEVLGPTEFQLQDVVLGVNYAVGDSTYNLLANAVSTGLFIQVLDPPNAGGYRITNVLQTPGFAPIILVLPAIPGPAGGPFRWSISSSIYIDLAEPKQTRIAGSDLRTTLGSPIVSTISGVDFANYGVSPNDILRITSGALIQGDYVVKVVGSPFFGQITVDRPLTASVNGAQYSIFRPNPAGGLIPPFLRVDSIALLDTSSQPVGTTVPYANPINVESLGFANSANGIKADVTDAIVGIVLGIDRGTGTALPLNVVGLSLDFSLPKFTSGPITFTVTFTGVNPLSPFQLASQINAACSAATGGALPGIAVGEPIGIIPATPQITILGGTAVPALFGTPFTHNISIRDITSATIDKELGWASLRPVLDGDFDVAQVLDGDQIGFFWLDNGVGEPVPNMPFDNTYDPLRTRIDFLPQIGVHVQVGSRSLGKARLYFLDPTSFEINSFPGNPDYTIFTLMQLDGSVLRYFADPTNSYAFIPAPPSGAKPLDGTTGGVLPTGTLQSISTDFVAAGTQLGDELVIDFIPVTGTVMLSDPVASMNGAVLKISLDNGPVKAITFIHDSLSISSDAVTRAGVITQINQQAGQTICSLNGSNQVVFNPTVALTIYKNTDVTSANPLLGFPAIADVFNTAPDAGTYVITAVAPGGNVNQVSISPATFPSFPTAEATEQFRVRHVGIQRIVSTTMSTQQDIADLYYFDATLVSEGTGNAYNIGANQPMTVKGYKSDGYYLTTKDPNLTFSPVEKPELHMSLSILPVGVSDDPANAVQLSGQNLQITYDQSSLVQNVSNFITSDTERVINESSLARHLIPYYVRFDMTYYGGSGVSVVLPDITSYITALPPTGFLEVSSLNNLVLARGATAVQNPITLVAVIHNFDRSISVEQSEDKLNTGVLAAFIPDVLNVKRNVSS